MPRSFLFVTCAWLACACGSSAAGNGVQSDPADAGPAATFIDVQLVFNGAGCTESGCHGGDEKGGLNLADDPAKALINVAASTCKDGRKLVVPGKPNVSYLLNKVRGVDLCGGARMPKGCGQNGRDPCLSDDRLATIESWIRNGAPAE